jgi:hypothetical protein
VGDIAPSTRRKICEMCGMTGLYFHIKMVFAEPVLQYLIVFVLGMA